MTLNQTKVKFTVNGIAFQRGMLQIIKTDMELSGLKSQSNTLCNNFYKAGRSVNESSTFSGAVILQREQQFVKLFQPHVQSEIDCC